MVKRLFNLDLHISVIEDVRYVCKTLFKDTVEITNWSISGHNWVFGKPSPHVDFVNKETWRNISVDMIQSFQQRYDKELCQYDGFIVTHTPVFAMLFEKYGKPVLIVNSCRYDQPFCWSNNQSMKEAFHKTLENLKRNNLLFIVSNNAADKEYLLKGTGLESIHIPSLCLYTNAKHNPTRKGFIQYGRDEFFPQSEKLVKRTPNYSWTDLYSYEGIVHAPYEMSTMSIFEQFWAGVPLFFPTKRFYKDRLYNGKMEFISIYDKWGKPKLESEIDEWLDRADFYALPFLYYYDSFEELLQKLDNFIDIHKEARENWIQKAIPAIMEQWKGVFTGFLTLEEKQRIEVIMRMCPDSRAPLSAGGRPHWFTKEACFDKLYRTKDDDTHFTILFDGSVEGHWIKKYPVKVVPIQGGTDESSILIQYNYIMEQSIDDNTILYSLEDDYVHRDGWPTILREGLSSPLLPSHMKLDYVTLYDHRDKYTYGMYNNLLSKICISPSVHWRTVPSTTNTWATLFKTFKKDLPIFMHYRNLDHTKFLELGRQGRILASPVPGYSTHAHPEYLSPCVNWEFITHKE